MREKQSKPSRSQEHLADDGLSVELALHQRHQLSDQQRNPGVHLRCDGLGVARLA